MTQRDRAMSVRSWPDAAWRSALLLSVCFVGFLVIPDRLVVALSTRVAPRVRDALVSAWVIAFFVAASVLFVRMQRGRHGA